MQDGFDRVPIKDDPEDEGETATHDGFDALAYGWDCADRCCSSLKEMTRPDHNWALIYLLATIYILIIFPGCYFIGRRRLHYLFTYGAIVGAIVVFSLAFLYVGRRGYGETTIINSVSIARHIGDDSWDVMQWSNAFVTQGGTYTFRHQGQGSVYSSLNGVEAVNGTIALSGTSEGLSNRTFKVDIPPFSSRPFIHRHRVAYPDFQPRLISCVGAEALEELEVEIDEKRFPRDQLRSYVISGSYVYKLTQSGNRLKLGEPAGTIERLLVTGQLLGTWSAFDYYSPDISTSERYESMFHALLAHHMQIRELKDLDRMRVPPDRLRLLVYAAMPDEFRMQSPPPGQSSQDSPPSAPDLFAKQNGRTLFVYDLLREEASKDKNP